ncbi:beta-1,6-N-acetylglucosaminyltransferase [Alkalihalobacterium alkalinitrilicum]|uniref:beta-1,6-N-acetylglucosaminyltransferase n=1 Tax=Alkalihalobacterium alkalinitrilicum TaxID=427920 RepID=UPI001303F30F|nr:beta-1,6-N-acetylglucosaminyltransferase [Alkalihalobacterium alkalinitrilicum]
MNIAYLILAHKNPHQLERLIKAIYNDKDYFIIHYDGRSNETEYKDIQKTFATSENVYFPKRHKCYWGHFSIVEATLECIKFLNNNQITYDYAILLSGQDYPIKSPETIRKFLIKNNGYEFIHYEKLPNNNWKNGGMNRLNYPYFLGEYMLTFDGVYGGSQWWCLSKKCLEYILSFINTNPHYISFFKNEVYKFSDEMFFQTIIMNSSFKEKVICNDLKYIDWSKRTRPAILTFKDFKKLIYSNKLFARKFDFQKSAILLNMLDKYLKTR